ncbi:mitochondrial large subunit ribosomal protein-domain-containing protein [Irpex rosettiformis]|uniref:Mitochondrial large subunit ribosomal protein-domain-containing protein n=1 Tax=Irpex rosettiformis TaxID=378272 RepID=A0ACB8UJW9_9APHY|nr:mitochondrial large subunit ribosomal protein-domain-containing protein [Irpex rosettiformis]
MLRTITQRLQPAFRSRCYSQLLAATGTASANAPTQIQNTSSTPAATAVRHPYFVPRNTQGSIPVFTDYRNHNRVFTLVRNVEGNVNALAADLKEALFEPGSHEAARLKVTISQGRHIALQGGNWKRKVVKWLEAKGF